MSDRKYNDTSGFCVSENFFIKVLDKCRDRVYNSLIFYERTVNTVTIRNNNYQMPKLNITILKHGVCPICSAMC